MKKILYIILAVLTLSSCNKWFDVEPKGDSSGEDIFSAESAYRDYINGIYTGLASEELYGSNLTLGGIEFLGQNMNPVSADMVAWTNMDFSGAKAQQIAKVAYAKLYYAIFQCNDFLELMARHTEVEYIEGSDKMMNAEIRALRAMLHFELLRLFSPAYTTNAQASNIAWASSTTTSEPMTTEQLTKKIISELDEATKQLEIYDPLVTGINYDTEALKGTSSVARRWKLNYYAAQTVKARALMSVGTTAAFGEALTALQSVINSEKYKFVRVTTSIDAEFSTEFLFALPSPKTGFCAISEMLFTTQGVTISTANVLPNTMSADDPRKSKWYNMAKTNIRPKFAPEALTEGWQTPPAIPVVKIGEVYLMAAECAASAISTAKGAEYFNLFIENRNSPDKVLLTSSSAVQLFASIDREYTYEFIGEGIRFHRNKRLNRDLNRYDGSGVINNMGSRSLPIIK